jgi:hypothetical protein
VDQRVQVLQELRDKETTEDLVQDTDTAVAVEQEL